MTKETSLPAKQRIWELDALRGLCILCMVAIHAFWDLSAFGGFAFDLPGWFLFCRQYGHILFILLSGLCATLASRSFQRGVYVFGAALVISYVTFFMVNVLNFPSDMLIWFGILHMLGVCMMLFPLFKRLPVWALAVLGVGFVALGVWFESFRIPVNFLFPLGLRAPGLLLRRRLFPAAAGLRLVSARRGHRPHRLPQKAEPAAARERRKSRHPLFLVLRAAFAAHLHAASARADHRHDPDLRLNHIPDLTRVCSTRKC